MKEFLTEEGMALGIGEILVKEGLVKKSDVEKAILIQEEEKKEKNIPLGQILIKEGMINEPQLQTLMNHSELKDNIGDLVVKQGFINPQELDSCILNKNPNESISECLLKRGYISNDDLAFLLQQQVGGSKLGELAVKLKMINNKDLEKALNIKGSVRTIGEILSDLNLISPIVLNRILKKYKKQLKLGEILLNQGILDDEKLNSALREQRHSAEPLGFILLKNNFVSADQLYSALSKQYNIPYKTLDKFSFNESQKQALSNIVTQKYAEKHLVLPLSLEGNNLTLAVSLPENIRVMQELSSVYSHLKMNCNLITDDKFHELYETLYGKTLQSYKIPKFKEIKREEVDQMQIDLESVEDHSAKEAPYGISDMEANEVVNFIIKYGIMNGASDIHIEQDRQGAKLRYRFDGVLHPLNLKWLDDKLQTMIPSIISRIKVMSNLDIAERRIPQDGVFRINFFDKDKNQRIDLDFRVATCPAIVGENITIRILDPRKASVNLDYLGHSPHVLEPLKQLLKSSAGMILVSGPTGSGKTSTLYSALQYVYNPGIKIITAEDPIEYSFPGIMQTQVKSKIGLNFARFLRSFLRLDPDVILVGEIRDEETAKIGFDAAQTGHLLLSTIHTNDSFSSITRLLDLNIEYNQIASSLMGVLAQRLIRKICPSCKKKYVPTNDEWGLIYKDYPENMEFYKGEGCDQCGFSGYKGRTLISELMVVGREISNALNRGLGENEIKNIALESGTKTMVDDGLMKLDQTTLAEIVRVVPHEMLKEFRSRQKGIADQTEKMISGKDLSRQTYMDDDENVIISDPAMEPKIIARLYDLYSKEKREMGIASGKSELSYFKEFISDSYKKICDKFNCSKVKFYLDRDHDSVKICAEPVE